MQTTNKEETEEGEEEQRYHFNTSNVWSQINFVEQRYNFNTKMLATVRNRNHCKWSATNSRFEKRLNFNTKMLGHGQWPNIACNHANDATPNLTKTRL